MVFIVSQAKFDQSTDDVIDWIIYSGHQFTRVNGDDIYEMGDGCLEIDNQKSVLNVGPGRDNDRREGIPATYHSGWYRRWSNTEYLNWMNTEEHSGWITKECYKILRSDDATIRDFFISRLAVKRWLTEPGRSAVNKLVVLDAARKIGLNIPETLVCGSKERLGRFIGIHQRVITKDLTIPYFFLREGQERFISHTKMVDEELFDELPDNFRTSLFQRLIEKEFEIRSFYLDGKFYSMAIFSQGNKKTEVDFRQYDMEKPNRTVPYLLPEEVENRIRKLLVGLKLNTASVDIIKDLNENYIFLEINPIGQFGMTSRPCNFYLEKKVAKYLTEYED